MERSLIVARLDQQHRSDVARAFSDSDTGELPALLRVRRRSLFSFHGLYFHLIDAEPGLAGRIDALREHPLFVEITQRLAPYVDAYDRASWRGPRDALADQFYTWEADR